MSEYSNIFLIQKGRKRTRVRLYENSWAFGKLMAYPLMDLSHKLSELPAKYRKPGDAFFEQAVVNTGADSCWKEIELTSKNQSDIANNSNPGWLRKFISQHCYNHCGALIIWVTEVCATDYCVDRWDIEYAFMIGDEDVHYRTDIHMPEDKAQKELNRFLNGEEYFAYHKNHCDDKWMAVWNAWMEFFNIKYYPTNIK